MVPDYRHASPPPVPDGDTVRRPPADPLPRRQLAPGLAVAGIVLALMLAGITGVLTR